MHIDGGVGAKNIVEIGGSRERKCKEGCSKH
jgi:hypothetical protein